MTATHIQLARLAAEKPTSMHEKMAQRRRALGLTRAGLAARIGVSARTLEAWEQGKRLPGDIAQATWLAALEQQGAPARPRKRSRVLPYDPQVMDRVRRDRLGGERSSWEGSQS